jgi:hypothetical protein
LKPVNRKLPIGLFAEQDEEEDTFIPLKKPVEPKKPLFGDDSEEETVKPADTVQQANVEEIKKEDANEALLAVSEQAEDTPLEPIVDGVDLTANEEAKVFDLVKGQLGETATQAS